MVKAIQVKGFPNYYVTDNGDVYSRNYGGTGRIKKLKPHKNHKGYLWINLGRQGRCFVHRMVAQAFIPNPENKPQINHKNGIRDDNRIENLEWATGSENAIHAYRVLHRVNNLLGKRYMKGRFGKENPNHKAVQQIKNGKIIAEFDAICEASRILNLNHANIVCCCQGKRKTAGGCQWKYKK